VGGWPLQLTTVAFIVVSLVVYLSIGTAPAALLVFVGGFNGLILPVGMTVFLYIGWFRQRDVLGGYAYPKWLLVAGTIALAISFFMASQSIGPVFDFLSA
jgi:Mn2+/Fe2+ NRAMP family transporter